MLRNNQIEKSTKKKKLYPRSHSLFGSLTFDMFIGDGGSMSQITKWQIFWIYIDSNEDMEIFITQR